MTPPVVGNAIPSGPQQPLTGKLSTKVESVNSVAPVGVSAMGLGSARATRLKLVAISTANPMLKLTEYPRMLPSQLKLTSISLGKEHEAQAISHGIAAT